VISSKSTAQGLPLDAGFTYGFWVCAGVGLLGIIAVAALPSARRRHADAVAVGVEDLLAEPAGE
jgi:hypothetical protein